MALAVVSAAAAGVTLNSGDWCSTRDWPSAIAIMPLAARLCRTSQLVRSMTSITAKSAGRAACNFVSAASDPAL